MREKITKTSDIQKAIISELQENTNSNKEFNVKFNSKVNLVLPYIPEL